MSEPHRRRRLAILYIHLLVPQWRTVLWLCCAAVLRNVLPTPRGAGGHSVELDQNTNCAQKDSLAEKPRMPTP